MISPSEPAALLADLAADVPSIVELAGELIRTPSQGGSDDYQHVLSVLATWLADHDLPCRTLHGNGERVGLACSVAGARPGPRYVLDACVDTAPVGTASTWSFPPFAGDVVDGWLRGRGAADSKTAAAVFCHIAARLHLNANTLHGRFDLLLDADEHTGGFGGVKAFFAGPDAARDVAGVMIGYPGPDFVVVGGRGVLRARVRVYGTASHSGSRVVTTNAVVKGARLVGMLFETHLPAGSPSSFPLPPRITATRIEGGNDFTVVPDVCAIELDIRLTPAFDESAALGFLQRVVDGIDEEFVGARPTETEVLVSWPPYQLRPDEQPAQALLAAARWVGLDPQPKVAGPSNIGNFLAGLDIPATAGFGVEYRGLHGADEMIRVDSIPRVEAAYFKALIELMSRPDAKNG